MIHAFTDIYLHVKIHKSAYGIHRFGYRSVIACSVLRYNKLARFYKPTFFLGKASHSNEAMINGPTALGSLSRICSVI